MSESVQVRRIQTLRDLDRALGRFARAAKESLDSIHGEIQRSQGWLEERQRYWQREADRSRWGGSDWAGDLHSDLRMADGEAALTEARRWLRAVQEEVDGYQFYASRMEALITEEIPRAQAFLRDGIADLERYLAVTRESPIEAVHVSDLTGLPMDVPSGPVQLLAGLKKAGGGEEFDIQLFLSSKIPGPHVVQLEVIEYDTDVTSAGEALLAEVAERPKRKVTLSIYFLNPQNPRDEYGLGQTVAHEVGHNVYRNVLNPEVRSRWEQISAQSGTHGYVSEYAREDASEDFAESYAFFLTDPDALLDVSETKHRFLHEAAFEGIDRE